jgi:perosamine synthetase
MWPRKRLDIGWSDLARAAVDCGWPGDQRALAIGLEASWSATGDALACLSVRSGFDLLLTALDLPAGSEVLMSAVTIHDMARVVEAHGLTPVPVDLDIKQMAPRAESLAQAVTPHTGALVVAHLFGGRIDMRPIAEFARRHGLLLIEDAAQAFAGPHYTGSEGADVSMFSFGPIKTATALGGALLRVRDPRLLARMRRQQDAWPAQGRRVYPRRAAKYAVLKAMSSRPVFSTIVRGCKLLGRDYDRLVNGMVRGFAGTDFFERIRRRPSAPLLALLARRLAHFDSSRLAARARVARRVMGACEGTTLFPGSACTPHVHWLLPVLAAEPRQLIAALADQGFDATRGQSLTVVPAPLERPDIDPQTARAVMDRIVFLPCYAEMPSDAVARLADLLADHGSPPPETPSVSRETAAAH